MKQALVWIVVAFLFFVFFSYRYSGMQERKVASPPAVDSNGNGFPDVVELYGSDAANFYRWFSSIAISQSYARSGNWTAEYNDCAGLLRFSFVEALKKHTPQWFKRYPYLFAADIPSVRKYNYPDVPVLGVSVFRVGRNKFSKKATAKQLLKYNFHRDGSSVKGLKVGEIVVFYLSSSNRYLMVVFCGGGLYAWQECGPNGFTIRRSSRLPSSGEFLGVYSWSMVHRK